jgi:hypothetical protein
MVTFIPTNRPPYTIPDGDALALYDHRFQCAVFEVYYNFTTHSGLVTLPEDAAVDMMGAVAFFEAIDPHARLIETLAGGRPEATYMKTATGWVAQL